MHPDKITAAWEHFQQIAGPNVRTLPELQAAIHAWDLRWNSDLWIDTADGWEEFWGACFQPSPRSKAGNCWAYSRTVQFPRRPVTER